MSSLELTQDMLEVIRKHLPSQTAGQLKAALDRLEHLEQVAEERRVAIEQRDIQVADLRAQVDLLQENLRLADDLEAKAIELDTLDHQLKKREDRIDMAVNTTKMDMMKSHIDTIERLVEKVFGHPGVSVTTYKSGNVPVADQYGISQHQSSETETTNRHDTKD